MRVAMAMPLTGFDDEPSSPVIREDTTEKKKPNTMIATADRTAMPTPGTAWSCGRNDMKSGQGQRSAEHDRDRDVALGAPPLGTASPARRRRSRNDARKLSTMVGMALTRLMIPPAATAPAPM